MFCLSTDDVHGPSGDLSGAGGGLTPVDPSDGSQTFYPSGSPYRIQRHAANIRERKRMLRSVILPFFFLPS